MAGRAGRRPRLRSEDLRSHREEGLKRGPGSAGLWAAWRIVHRVEHECGVKYHPTQAQAWRILLWPVGPVICLLPIIRLNLSRSISSATVTSYMTLTAARILGQ